MPHQNFLKVKNDLLRWYNFSRNSSKPLIDKRTHVLDIIRQNQFPNDGKRSYEKIEDEIE